MSPSIIPATREHLAALGERPPRAGRAFAAVLDGEALGVCGYYHDRGCLVLYSKVKPELRRWKKVIVRGARLALAAALRVRAPVAAIASPEIPGSVRMLEGLGFERIEGDVFWRAPWQPQR